MRWQRRVLDVGLEIDPETGLFAYREVIVTVMRQQGKALDCRTPILTTDGWKTMGAVQVGDSVYAADGSPVRVTFASEVFLGHRCYEVEFYDGARIVADADHRWWLWDKQASGGRRGAPVGEWRTVTTAKLADSWGKIRPGNGRRENRYRVACGAVVDSEPLELPVDPYLFGLWLGDGSSTAARITAGASDADHVIGAIQSAGYVVTSSRVDARTGAHDIGFKIPAVVRDGFEARARRLGVWGNKHIPEVFLSASAHQRRELLAGLMDSDGTIGHYFRSPRVEFSVCSERLAADVLRLCRSLGIRTRLQSGPAKLNGVIANTRWRLAWTPTFNPFRLPRKANQFCSPMTDQQKWMSVVGVRGVPSVPTRCIAVDHPSHVYLVGELFTPTHNTAGVILPVELDRCLMWAERQRVIYTAQTGSDAREKLLNDQVPAIEKSFGALVRQVYRAKGEESIRFKNGSGIELAASSEDAGHGFTVDLGVLDECWADEDDRREQAILPAMITRPWAQMWLTSTQGTERSTFLNSKTELGRAAASEDRGTGIAYFEWSIPEDADIENPETWWAHMPALGYTIQPAAIAHALQSMVRDGNEAEWRRAFGNQRTHSISERVIPDVTWDAVCDPAAEVARDAASVTFGLDVHPERSSAAIVASDQSVCELIDHRPGTGWVLERAKSLSEKWRGTFVIDGNGPALSLADDLENENIPVKRLSTPETAAACGRMYDAIADMRVKFRTAEQFDIAVAGLAKKPMGDRFIWARQASMADITPFFAACLAYRHVEPTQASFY